MGCSCRLSGGESAFPLLSLCSDRKTLRTIFMKAESTQIPLTFTVLFSCLLLGINKALWSNLRQRTCVISRPWFSKVISKSDSDSVFFLVLNHAHGVQGFCLAPCSGTLWNPWHSDWAQNMHSLGLLFSLLSTEWLLLKTVYPCNPPLPSTVINKQSHSACSRSEGGNAWMVVLITC